MMGEVVDHQDAVFFTAHLLAPFDPFKSAKAVEQSVVSDPQVSAHDINRQGVFDIVPADDRCLDQPLRSALETGLKETSPLVEFDIRRGPIAGLTVSESMEP